MRSAGAAWPAIAASTILALVGGSTALAQSPGCQVVEADDPPRKILRCADGLTLTAEQDTAFRLHGGRSGRPRAVDLTDRGLLIEAPPGGLRRGFQVRTPHAVAAVRGTSWAVDVTARNTAVFVVRGTVSVRRSRTVRGAVTLRAGDGVDVPADGTALQVKHWAAARAEALLARFGR